MYTELEHTTLNLTALQKNVLNISSEKFHCIRY